MKMQMHLGSEHGTKIALYAQCNSCETVLGPFVPDDLMQPERILCPECGKSEPVFCGLTFDSLRDVESVWDTHHTKD